MEVKSWTVVIFTEDKSVEAVPSNWIQGDFCHWPPLSTDKLVQAINKCEKLNTCWPMHKIRHLRNGTFDDYTTARSKSTLAEYMSDLNSDIDEGGARKRRKIQKCISSSDSEESISSFLPSPPKVKITKDRDVTDGTVTVHQKNDKDNRFKTIEKVGEIRNPSKSLCSQKNSKLTDIVLQNQRHSKTIDKDREATSSFYQQNVCAGCMEKDKYLKTLTEQIHMVRGITIDILSEIKNLKTDLRSNNNHQEQNTMSFTIKFPDVKFPIGEDVEIDALELVLLDRESLELLATELSKIGGANPYNFAKRVLSTCLTNDMALKCWLGRKGKKTFSNLNLAKVVICEKANITKSQKEMEVAVQTWLKRASDRRAKNI